MIFPANAIDFYKAGHIDQYPPGTNLIYSNFTCRSDKYCGLGSPFDHKAVFFGLQGMCKWLFQDLWQREFFDAPRRQVVEAYRSRMVGALGGNVARWDHIEELHKLGYLPILIKALPEGSRVDMRVPMFTIRNTLPEFYWLTNFLETQISAEIWKPIRNATVAYHLRSVFTIFAQATDSPMSFVKVQGHDFSCRGMSGIEDAAKCGCAHLLSFMGTDTVSAIDYAQKYYGGDDPSVPIGASVPATEHSVMCMSGPADECALIKRLITEIYPIGIVSIVSDSWDFWRTITEYARDLKDDIMQRGFGSLGVHKVVFRPDSGDPVKVICGDPEAPDGSPARLGAVECLWNIFGGTRTGTGHRLLDSHVGLIYGDSITPEIAKQILAQLARSGFASANIVLGIGSWTYQNCTRDSFGCAIKTTYGEVNGVGREIYKDPVTDIGGVKRSARGLLRVEYADDGFRVFDRQTWVQEREGILAPVYANGEVLSYLSLSDVRKRLHGDSF